jgi:uncharacterized protein (TIGR03066 family)
MKKSKFIVLLLICLAFVSCTNSDSPTAENPFSKLIIGKWTTETSPVCDYREFKSDGTMVYTQNICSTPIIDNFTYKIEGNILKLFSNVHGDNATDIENIISLTENEMKISFSGGSGAATEYRTFYKIK